jgi:hypothetical protein
VRHSSSECVGLGSDIAESRRPDDRSDVRSMSAMATDVSNELIFIHAE